jgi:hypothetical protein
MTQHDSDNYRVLRLHMRHISVPQFSLVSVCVTRNQNTEANDGGPSGLDRGWETRLANHLPMRVSFTMHGYADADTEEKCFR